jgi:diaminohydroxyphosphoribosylaminopyrimidine deaminase/5-amino-6-(5-phosphoribosylamino)uracil reductase
MVLQNRFRLRKTRAKRTLQNNFTMPFNFSDSDEAFMREAIALAWLSVGHTRPNPPVGAIVVKDGRIIGRGRHIKCGKAHAEAAALSDSKESPEGATVYCTLEPCSKVGRVGACCDALIASKVSRVVWACNDPNPVNAAKAFEILSSRGIKAEYGLLEKEASELIKPFSKHVLTGYPFVTVKLAMSLDGKICDNAGDAKWISCPEARKATGLLRETCDAIMVGANTVRCDNPSLLSHGKANDDLIRVIISESGNLPPDSQIFTDEAKERTLVLKPSRFGSLKGVMKHLGSKGIMHVLCEGGLSLARSLYDEGLVDEWISVLAPIVIGDKPITTVKSGSLIESSTIENNIITRWRTCSRD